jgi:hypothetical protein
VIFVEKVLAYFTTKNLKSFYLKKMNGVLIALNVILKRVWFYFNGVGGFLSWNWLIILCVLLSVVGLAFFC